MSNLKNIKAIAKIVKIDKISRDFFDLNNKSNSLFKQGIKTRVNSLKYHSSNPTSTQFPFKPPAASSAPAPHLPNLRMLFQSFCHCAFSEGRGSKFVHASSRGMLSALCSAMSCFKSPYRSQNLAGVRISMS